jgi:hypothetical protein
MAASPIFVEAEEEVPGVIERIRGASAQDVPLVLPLRSRFGQSRFNFQLLREYASRMGKRVTIVSSDPAVQRMAQENGFAAVSAVEHFDAGYVPPRAATDARYGPGQGEARPAPTPPAPEPYARPAPEPYQPPFVSQGQAGVGPTGPPSSPSPAPLGWSMDAGSEPAPPVDPATSPWASAPPPGVWSRQAFQAPSQAPVSGAGGSPPSPPRPFAPPRSGASTRVFPNRLRIGMPTGLAPPVVKPGRLFFYGAAALVLLVGIVASIVYVPSAEVDMVAQAQPFASNVSVSGDPGKQPIPVRAANASRSTSQSFNVAGAKVTPAQVAKGSVTFDATNCFGQAFGIANGTRLHGPGGIAFATNGGDVSVGGQGNPQQAQTSIVATQPGQQGNVAAGPFTFDNPGAGGCIQVNGGPTAGGTDQKKSTEIQQTDLTTAQGQLDQALKQQLTDQLSKGAQKGEKLAADQIQWKATFTADHKVGDAAATFTATLVENGTAYYYHPDDVTRAFVDSLKRNVVPAGKEIAGDVSTNYGVTANPNGHLVFSGKATGFLAPQLDSEAIKSQVTGRSPSQVKQNLKGRYPVQDVQVRQFPFGLPFMPLSASRVTVRYQILSGGGSQASSG